MDREVSIVVEIGVMLLAVAAVIGIIWFTVFMGNNIFISAADQGSQLLVEVESGTLDELTKTENNIMPASAAYNIVRKNALSIPDYNCEFCSKGKNYGAVDLYDITGQNAPCIINHLKGSVNLIVSALDTGGYQVNIKKIIK